MFRGCNDFNAFFFLTLNHKHKVLVTYFKILLLINGQSYCILTCTVAQHQDLRMILNIKQGYHRDIDIA